MPTPQPQIRPTDYLLEKTTILIVDDEPGPRESLKMILSPAHQVVCCSTGAEALEVLRDQSVDVATIDLNMPAMKGDELMRRIRAEFPAVEIIVITGCGTVRTAVEGLRHGIADYISKPFDVVQVSSAVADALSRKRCRERMVEFLEGVGRILGMSEDSRMLIEDLETNGDLRNKLSAALTNDGLVGQASETEDADRTLEFLNVLAQALESRDSYLRGHAQRVAAYAEMLAARLGLTSQETDEIRIAAFLHDFGKLGLDPDRMEPAQERSSADGLTNENHPELGAQLVKPLGFSSEVCMAIQHHHERWDGGGFPSVLSGAEIPLGSRIIATVDAYDLMTMPRPGEKPLLRAAAVEELEKQAGHRFDPDIVRDFVALIESGALEIENPAEQGGSIGAAG